MKAAYLSEPERKARKIGKIYRPERYRNHDVVKCTEFSTTRKGYFPIVKSDRKMSLYQIRTRSGRWSEGKINKASMRLFKWPTKAAAGVGPFEKLTYKLYFAIVVK